MKSYNHLFEKIINYNNLKTAIYNSSKRKRKRADVRRVFENMDKYIKKIQRLLTERTYKIQPHNAIRIFDGSSHKERLIIQPKYIFEQIIHHAVAQVLQPILMKGMYDFSCGSIPKRGGHYGKRYIEKFIKRHNNSEIKYCLKLDITHYYQSVDVNILKEKLRKIIHDEDALYVIDLILDSNKAIYNNTEIDMGLPIGYYTSQWFANFYLQEFDHFVKEQLHAKCYVRYVDDIVMFGRNKKQLHKDFERIKEYLAEHHLQIKPNWQIFRFDYIKDGQRRGRPLDYMGFRFYRDKTTLRRSIMLKATRKANKIKNKKSLTWFDSSQILSYLGWFIHTDTYNVYKKFIRPYVNVSVCKKVLSIRQQKINKENSNGTEMGNIRKSCQTEKS